MKVLYFGGQKCGKSALAEAKALLISETKPYYIATYDNSYGDAAMQDRVHKHRLQRQDNFESIEEPYDLVKVIKEGNTYLIDCVSMWLFNNLEKEEDYLKEQLQTLCKMEANIVFVLNDVNCGVIPYEKESRRFVDLSGILGQVLAKGCDEVYEVKYGLEVKLK